MDVWGTLVLTALCLLLRVRGQGDFDLADALDDHDSDPTKKPSSGLYPHLPKPQPDRPDTSGNIYPPPRPPPARPQPGGSDGGGYHNDARDEGRYPPRPRPPAAGGFGGGGGGSHNPGYDGYGNTHGGGRHRPNPHGSSYGNGYSTYGDQHGGNTVAKVVSPIVSMVVVTLVGAAVGYYNRRGNCCRRNHAPETV